MKAMLPKHIKVLILPIIVFAGCASFAQIKSPTILPPSPESAALGKFSDIPVSNYTGIPNISVPLWNIVAKDIEVPISVDYHASGVKVDEVASSVGLGWALNAGGAVTRSTIGIPDELSNAEPIPFPEQLLQESTQYPGYYEMTALYSTYGDAVSNGVTDPQPDLFYYNFGGMSGKFVYDLNKQAHTIPYLPLDISTSADLKTIIIKTTNGFVYTFESSETTFSKSKLIEREGIEIVGDVYTPPTVVENSTYAITKIESPSGAFVLFHYESNFYEYRSSMQASDYHLLPTQQIYCSPTDLPKGEVWLTRTTVTGSRIKRIEASTGEEVIFTYNTTKRLDVESNSEGSNAALKEITVTNMFGNVIKSTVLEHDYFKTREFQTVGLADKDLHCKLKLLSVTESGKQPYSFEYHESEQFPPRFSYAQDIWGYYNGSDGASTSLPRVAAQGLILDGAQRTPSLQFMKIGTIKAINYPTGGRTEFEFEAHSYMTTETTQNWPTPVTQGNFISVSSDPEAPLRQTNTFTIPENVELCSGLNAFMASVTISFNNTGGTELQTIGYSGAASVVINGPNGISITASSAGYSYYETCLPVGEYTVVAMASGLHDPESGNLPAWASASITWREKPVVETTLYENIVGGLRIKKIVDKNIDGSIAKSRTFNYNDPTTNKSSGFILNSPKLGYNNQLVTMGEIRYEPTVVTCDYFVRETQSSLPLSSIKGSNVAYSFVTILQDESGESGKEVHQYSRVGNLKPEKQFPISPDTDYDWLRGLPIKKTIYKMQDGEFKEVFSEENHYRVYHNPSDFWAFRQSQSVPTILSLSEEELPAQDLLPYLIFENPSNFSKEETILSMKLVKDLDNPSSGFSNPRLYSFNYYKYVSVPIELCSTITTYKNSDNEIFSTEKRFYYDNIDHFQPTRIATSNSDGSISLTVNQYSGDFALDNPLSNGDEFVTAIASMNSSFQKSALVETSDWLLMNNIFKLINGRLNTFKIYNGKVRPFQTYQIENVIFQNGFTNVTISTSGQLEFDTKYKLKQKFDKYSSNGDLIEYEDYLGVKYSYMYGYNNSLLIAQAINTPINHFFYTSFEDAEGDSPLGHSKTGHKSKVNGFQKNLTGLSPGNYFLEFWKFDNNSWHFHSQEIFVASDSYQIQLTGDIDELSFQPKYAQVQTFTHKPGVGLLSTTDVNRKLTYYNYDSFGRLVNVADHDGNIVRSINYNYFKQ